MNTSQKTAKYLAITLAVVLIIGIFITIFSVGYFSLKTINNVKNYFNEDESSVVSQNEQSENSILKDVRELYIESDIGKVTIEQGENFKINYNSDDKVLVENYKNEKKCVIKNERDKFIDWSSSNVTITIPKNYKFDVFSVKSGAGNIFINDITCKNFILKNGAGKVNCSNIVAIERVEIDGGSGEIIISDSKFKNADIDTGVGFTKFKGTLSGDCEIDHGMGELVLNLLNKEKDFNYKIKKGIGEISLNSDLKSDVNISNNAPYNLEIKGGIGRIEITIAN